MARLSRTYQSERRCLPVHPAMWLAFLPLLFVLPRALYAADTCGVVGGYTYSFSDGIPIASLAVKELRPTRPGQLTITKGAGTLSLLDSTRIPLKVRGQQSKGLDRTTRYSFSGHVSAASVHGILVFKGCPQTLTKVKIGLARRHQKRFVVQDPLSLLVGARLRPSVLMLDSTDIGGLTVDPTDPTILDLPPTDPLAGVIMPGTVLVIGITPATPRGLLRRVVSVTAGPLVTIVTEPAALADAFSKMHLRISDASLATAQHVMLARTLDVGCTRPLCIGAAISVDVDDGNGASVSFSGNLFADAGVDVDLDVDFDDIDVSGHIEVAGDIGGSFDISAMESVDFGDKKEKKFDEIDFPPIEVAGIEVTPKVKLFGGAHGGVTGGLDTGVDGKVFAKAGLVCQHIDDCAFELDNGLEFNSHLDLEASASAKLWIRPQIDLAIYDSATLFGSLTPFVKFDANPSNDPWWSLDGGVDGDIGIDVDAFFRTVTPFEKEFTVFEFHITDAPGPFGCAAPCLPPTIFTSTLDDAVVGSPYSVVLQGDGEGPLEWTLGSGALPDGISLETDGTLDGDPFSPGQFDFTVILTDSFGRTATQSLSITVEAPPPTPAPTSTPGVPPGCGDGTLDADEQCDQGPNNGTVGYCCTIACAFRTGSCFLDGFGPGNCTGTTGFCTFTIF